MNRYEVVEEMVLEPAAPFGDQRVARIRAANYFAIFEVLAKPQDAESAWLRASQTVNLDVPLSAGAAAAIGRLDVDDALVARKLRAVTEGFGELNQADIILEKGFTGYPVLLGESADSPRFLFVREEEHILEMPSLSVVGTREASDEGKASAMRLAHLLARRGIVVVSGLARGVDAAAHEGALKAGGRTIAVIGTPLTRSYPKENAALQHQIGVVGAVVSQFHPSATTLPLSFPLRNATMSALSLGTVVVEASETSGALGQARKALQQGRKVFIPRSALENPNLAWPKNLIARGANAFSTIDELVGVLENGNLIPRQDLSPPAPATGSVHAS